jgi:hypothetical protein
MNERMLLGALSSSGRARREALLRALHLVRTADYIAIYGTALGGVRRAWVLRMLSALLRRVRRIDA